MAQGGSYLGQRSEDEGPLSEKEVRNVEVVRCADDLVAVEQNVDIERPGLEALRLRSAGRADTPESSLDPLQRGEERAGRQRRIHGHHAIEVPALLVGRPAGLAFPRLRLP